MGETGESASGVEVEWQFDAPALDRVATWLDGQSRRGVRLLGSADLVDRYLDTTDWRFMRAGRSLRLREKGARVEATLKSLSTTTEGPRVRLEITQPLDAATIPGLLASSGEVTLIAKSLAGRADLLERGRVLTHRTNYEITGGRPRAPIATLSLDETRFGTGDGATMHRVEVELLDGVEPSALEPFIELLERACDLTAASGSKFERALEASGGLPSFPPKPPTPSRGATLGEIATWMVASQLYALAAAEPVARLGDDPEGVHDARVAIRRLRAGFRLLRDAFAEDLTPIREELRWLGGELGGVRDLDVLLEELTHWTDAGPAARGEALAPVRARLDADREIARGAMLAAFDSDRYERLLETLRGLLAAGVLNASAVEGARGHAAVLLRKAHRQFAAHARQVGPTSPDAGWHELRIDGKRLRYAIEFFEPVLGRAASRALATLRSVQDVLGEVHDAAIAAEHIAEIATRADTSTHAAFALGEWTGVRSARADALRADFPALLERFGKDWRRLLPALAR